MATKLLLADDSITIQKVVQLTFAAEDVQIESVTDGNLALEKLQDFKPDIVLADVFMPGRNGYEVCEAIKGDAALNTIPVILLVGTFEPFDELEASRVKCDAYLTKPFDTSELIRTVSSLVAESTSGRLADASEEVMAETGTCAEASTLVSSRARESFLGSNRILDLFDFPVPEVKSGPAAVREAAAVMTEAAGAEPAKDPDRLDRQAAASQVIPFPGNRAGAEALPLALHEEVLDLIAEKVVKRMSEDIVREIAWEVVPQLSEILIRQILEELNPRPEK